MSARLIVKICGVTRAEDAAMAVTAGADWLGLNFWPPSKRFVSLDAALAVARAARDAADAAGRTVALVGVFVNQPAEDIRRIHSDVGLDHVQLHGDETPEDCAHLAATGLSVIKAIALGAAEDLDRLAAYPVTTYLVDTPTPGYGGSGRAFDWSLARAACRAGARILLAGGLAPDNVARAVAEVAPLGVDVASGVERAPGIKDAARVRAFVAAARGMKA